MAPAHPFGLPVDPSNYNYTVQLAMSVPAAGGNPNLDSYDMLPDNTRMLKGFYREAIGGARHAEAAWSTVPRTGPHRDVGFKPPWSAAKPGNAWHGVPPHHTFLAHPPTKANTFRFAGPPPPAPPLRRSASTLPALPRTSASSLASSMDFSKTVAFQWNEPQASHRADLADPLRLTRRVWRRPGHHEGDGSTSTFWESKRGYVDEPMNKTRSDLFRGRANYDDLARQAVQGRTKEQAGRVLHGKEFANEFAVGTFNRGLVERGKQRLRGGQNYGKNVQTGQGFDGGIGDHR